MARIRLGDAARGLAYVLSGTVGAQLITLMVLPLLSRLYTPEDFGFFSLVLALTGLIGPFATLRLETAAMLPENVQHVRALVWLTAISSTVCALLAGAVLQVLTLNGVQDLEHYVALPAWVALMVLLYAAYALLSQLALRNREYALVSGRSLLRAGATALGQVGFGLAGQGAGGLVLSSAFGNVVGVASMYRATRAYFRFPGWRELRAAWLEFWRFPALFAPSALMNALGLQAPLIFVTIWYGVAEGGQLGMAERIVGLPLTLVGAAIGQVLDAEVSKRIREGGGYLGRSYARYSLALGAVALAVASLLGLLGGWLIPWILGDQWALAGTMVQVLALTSAVRLVASPLSKFLVLLQKSLITITMDIVRVLLLGFGILATISLGLQIVSGLWVIYSALSITYVATWVVGLVTVRRHRPGSQASSPEERPPRSN